MRKSEMITILLAEDNPADAELAREMLETSKILNELNWVQDGVEALAFLRREGQYATKSRPDLLLLDLNMPRKDGRRVLEEMKQDPVLRRIPVVVLTSSQAEEDIVKSYDLQAAAYVTKPVGLTGFGEIVKAIEGFWMSVVKYPGEAAP